MSALMDALVIYGWLFTIACSALGVLALALSHIDRPWRPRPRYRRTSPTR